ncbi:uncharacterized protein LOC105212114 isoform X1 [Zeugodacus cucurbitae]|uniref:uncharacterized protein LOC105212114 isoform X1 n=1 Tax=Zeugodacus cucurbitae TaxID=28588 RepID=UPI0023D907AB|nr:uncharacterized protein LOC105212114 isoform X1 [Zeugodacus cucurbitae]
MEKLPIPSKAQVLVENEMMNNVQNPADILPLMNRWLKEYSDIMSEEFNQLHLVTQKSFETKYLIAQRISLLCEKSKRLFQIIERNRAASSTSSQTTNTDDTGSISSQLQIIERNHAASSTSSQTTNTDDSGSTSSGSSTSESALPNIVASPKPADQLNDDVPSTSRSCYTTPTRWSIGSIKTVHRITYKNPYCADPRKRVLREMNREANLNGTSTSTNIQCEDHAASSSESSVTTSTENTNNDIVDSDNNRNVPNGTEETSSSGSSVTTSTENTNNNIVDSDNNRNVPNGTEETSSSGSSVTTSTENTNNNIVDSDNNRNVPNGTEETSSSGSSVTTSTENTNNNIVDSDNNRNVPNGTEETSSSGSSVTTSTENTNNNIVDSDNNRNVPNGTEETQSTNSSNVAESVAAYETVATSAETNTVSTDSAESDDAVSMSTTIPALSPPMASSTPMPMPSPPSDENAVHCTVIGPNGTRVPTEKFNAISFTSSSAATRSLLCMLFPEEVLATHTLSGKPSPAFLGNDRVRPQKGQLDPKKVEDIMHCVMSRTSCSDKEVRMTITTKCADSTKKFRRLGRTPRRSD